MKTAIQVRDLGKQYRIGALDRNETFREAIVRSLRSPFSGNRRSTNERIWALQDVCFEAAQGDVIGIIGRNGAGKSTLLKLLSRITEPTVGRVELHGRIGSLLEVGTGFHPELSGRENVYLNGAILGMKRAEVTRKFDEIVSFAEVERFVDTPVKRYSSGMYLRLAFAVAAFLECEILLVDEVLAVGDSNFQKKCLGRMRDVSATGRTVLFVSHNMAAIESLCRRCLYFSGGRLQADGSTTDIVRSYMATENAAAAATRRLEGHSGRQSWCKKVMRSVTLLDEGGNSVSSIRMGGTLGISVEFASSRGAIRPVLGVTIKNSYGMPIFGINNRIVKGYSFPDPLSESEITCHFRDLPLMPGSYSVDLYLGDEYQDYDAIYDAILFDVVPADVFGTGQLPGGECGSVFWPASWTVGQSPG